MTKFIRMNKLGIVACSWKAPNLVKSFVGSIRRNTREDYDLALALNEADDESIKYCRENNVKYVALKENYGTSAVDFAANFLNVENIVNFNDDMLVLPGWDKAMLGYAGRFQAVSAHLIERTGCPSNLTHVDDLGPVETAQTKFEEKYLGKAFARVFTWTHPILVMKKDWDSVGGYSNFMDMGWFPGHGLDDYFPYLLKKALGMEFITATHTCVYHGVSQTNRRIPKEHNDKHNSDYFLKKTGLTINEFKQTVPWLRFI
jgi:GT2 family glycosyltransferase